jgi:hypothetical protein
VRVAALDFSMADSAIAKSRQSVIKVKPIIATARSLLGITTVVTKVLWMSTFSKSDATVLWPWDSVTEHRESY